MNSIRQGPDNSLIIENILTGESIKIPANEVDDFLDKKGKYSSPPDNPSKQIDHGCKGNS